MQGTLSEIDLRSILQLIELGQCTGELLIETEVKVPIRHPQSTVNPESRRPPGPCPTAPPLHLNYWFLFFVHGQLVYAVDQNSSQLQRLQDYLQRYGPEKSISSLGDPELAINNAPEYACLWLLLAKNILTPLQARNIILQMLQEVLFDLLSLHQGRFTFELAPALDPLLTSFEVSPLVTQVAQHLQQWKHFHPQLRSPDQSLKIANREQLSAQVPEKLAQHLLFWAEHGTSLRQIGRHLHRDLPTVAKSLYPYSSKGLIHFSEPASSMPTTAPTLGALPRIVCIDDNRSVGKQIELMLKGRGLQVIWLGDPLVALSSIFQLSPQLIFCDITMPRLDGFEFCRMVRHSCHFCHTPLIMLTSKDAFLDRVLARLMGATDYLSKPFGEQELNLLIEKHLPLIELK
jgi:twitching motility two-component system response regulator PilG